VINPTLTIPKEELAAFCRRHHIRWLALFGSVLTDEFRPDSDVDVLVEFEPGHTPGLGIIDVEDELSALFGGRKIDLVSRQYLSRWIRTRVLSEAEVIYAEEG
jgi:predicted nucleotidyltransferase